MYIFLPWSQRFFLIFHRRESCDTAAKQWTWVVKQRERKTSGHFGLESHFHVDVRVRIRPSSSDWLIFLQTRKSIRLVRLIGNTEGMVGIFVTSFFTSFLPTSLPGKGFVGKILQFSVYMNVQDSSVFYIDFVSSSAFERIWPLYSRSIFQRLKVSTNNKALLTVINCKDVFAILPTGHRKSIYYNSVDPWCRQIPVPDRLFIPSPYHNFGCVL